MRRTSLYTVAFVMAGHTFYRRNDVNMVDAARGEEVEWERQSTVKCPDCWKPTLRLLASESSDGDPVAECPVCGWSAFLRVTQRFREDW